MWPRGFPTRLGLAPACSRERAEPIEEGGRDREGESEGGKAAPNLLKSSVVPQLELFR